MTDSTQFSTNELAARWGLKPATLRHYRSKGTGPVYQTLNRKCLPIGSPDDAYAGERYAYSVGLNARRPIRSPAAGGRPLAEVEPDCAFRGHAVLAASVVKLSTASREHPWRAVSLSISGAKSNR